MLKLKTKNLIKFLILKKKTPNYKKKSQRSDHP